MPVPFIDLADEERSGAAGYLRFVEEPDGRGVRGALFIMSTRGEPQEFTFSRIDLPSSVLWNASQARRHAVSSLMKALFGAANRVPDLLLALPEEIPDRVFYEDLEIQVPLCMVATELSGLSELPANALRLSDSNSLVWSHGHPAPGELAAKTIQLLDDRRLILEPFERASLGLQEAFDS